MPNNRRNIQVNQPNVEGNETVDKNGWPTPLSSPLNPLKLVVSDGSRGETRSFRAMSTSGEGSTPESETKVKGNTFDEMSMKVKKTVGNSLS